MDKKDMDVAKNPPLRAFTTREGERLVRQGYMQLVMPSVVAMAVRMLIANCTIVFHTFLLITLRIL